MPAGQLSSLDLSNIVSIFDAIHDIALNKSGLTWGSDFQYEYPDAKTLLAAATPVLITTCPEFDRFTRDAEPGGSKEMLRTMELVEPAWKVFVYGIFPYEANNRDSWRTTLQYVVQCMQTFGIYWALEQLDVNGNPTVTNNPTDFKVSKILTRDNTWFMEAQTAVMVYESLYYSP